MWGGDRYAPVPLTCYTEWCFLQWFNILHYHFIFSRSRVKKILFSQDNNIINLRSWENKMIVPPPHNIKHGARVSRGLFWPRTLKQTQDQTSKCWHKQLHLSALTNTSTTWYCTYLPVKLCTICTLFTLRYHFNETQSFVGAQLCSPLL